MSRKRRLSDKGLAKKDYRQFIRRLRKYFKYMPKDYNPYQRPSELEAPAESTKISQAK